MNIDNFLKEKGISTFEINDIDIKSLLNDYSSLIMNDNNNSYLRLAADFENYKKRVTKEKSDLVSSTKVKMLSSILDIDNDISIAINKISSNETKEGLNLILRKLESFLHSQGVEYIQTENYDPDIHEVVSVINSDEEKIIDVISKGYTLNGRPFRYPKIILGRNV